MMMRQTGTAAPVAHDRILTRMPVALSLGLDQAARADDAGGAGATTSSLSSASGSGSASGSKLASPPPGSGRGTASGTGGGLPVPASLARSEPEPARDLAESKIQAKQKPWPLSTATGCVTVTVTGTGSFESESKASLAAFGDPRIPPSHWQPEAKCLLRRTHHRDRDLRPSESLARHGAALEVLLALAFAMAVSFQPLQVGPGPAEGTTTSGHNLDSESESELRVQAARDRRHDACLPPWSNSLELDIEPESLPAALRLPSMSTVTPTFSESLAGILHCFLLELAALPPATGSGLPWLTGVAALVSAGGKAW
jgi:hypothetical protein